MTLWAGGFATACLTRASRFYQSCRFYQSFYTVMIFAMAMNGLAADLVLLIPALFRISR